MLGLSLGLIFLFYSVVPYFGLACDHGNSCKSKKEKVLNRDQDGLLT